MWGGGLTVERMLDIGQCAVQAMKIVTELPGIISKYLIIFIYMYMYMYVMLCYVMLCYVMLCYVMLCYVMLCYVMLF